MQQTNKTIETTLIIIFQLEENKLETLSLKNNRCTLLFLMKSLLNLHFILTLLILLIYLHVFAPKAKAVS